MSSSFSPTSNCTSLVYSRAEKPCSALQPRNISNTFLAAEILFPDSAEQTDKRQRIMLENTDPSWIFCIVLYLDLLYLEKENQEFSHWTYQHSAVFYRHCCTAVKNKMEIWGKEWPHGARGDGTLCFCPWATTHTSDALCPSLAAARGCGHSVWAGKHTWCVAVFWSGLDKTKLCDKLGNIYSFFSPKVFWFTA